MGGPVSSPRPSAPATSRHSLPPSAQVLDPALLLVPPQLPEAPLPLPLRKRRRRRKKSQPRNPTTTWDSDSSTKLQLFLIEVVASLFSLRRHPLLSNEERLSVSEKKMKNKD